MDDGNQTLFRGSRFVKQSTVTIGRRRSRKLQKRDFNFSHHNMFNNEPKIENIRFKAEPKFVEKTREVENFCSGDNNLELEQQQQRVLVKQKVRKSGDIGSLVKKYKKQNMLTLKLAIHQIEAKIDELSRVIENSGKIQATKAPSKFGMEAIQSQIVHGFLITFVIVIYVAALWMAWDSTGQSRSYKSIQNSKVGFLNSLKNFFGNFLK